MRTKNGGGLLWLRYTKEMITRQGLRSRPGQSGMGMSHSRLQISYAPCTSRQRVRLARGCKARVCYVMDGVC